MKLQVKTIAYLLLIALCLQANLYSMRPAGSEGKLVVATTEAEAAAHALAINIEAEHQKQAALQASQGDAKRAVATQQAELNSVFKKFPDELLPNILNFTPMPAECSAALLEHRKLKIEHKNITAFAQINQNQVATASANGTLKIWDLTTGAQVLELPQQNCAIITLITIDDTIIAFGLQNGGIKLWDITTNQLIATCNASEASSVDDRAVISLLKFSDRYIISAAFAEVNAWDISDIKNPRRIPLPGTATHLSELSKISDTDIAFDTTDGILILDLSDMEHPIQKETLNFDASITSCIRFSPTTITCGTAITRAVWLLDLSTKKTQSLEWYPFSLSLNAKVRHLSPSTFIACYDYGYKIWSMENPQNPTCIATINQAPLCNRTTIRLSDTSFAYAGDNAIHLYMPNAEALEAYRGLSLTNRARFATLVKLLNKRKNIQFPAINQLTLHDTERALCDKLPPAIKAVLAKNYGFYIRAESAAAADHKEG